MDEAGRCDRLLLIREGRLIADDTPGARPGRRPAPPTWRQAFLHLIRTAGDEARGGGMNPRILGSTTGRILRQLRHDRRTIALLLVVPVAAADAAVLHVRGQPATRQPSFDRIGADHARASSRS